jgi:hypothetical protein
MGGYGGMERALGPRNAQTDDRLLQLQQINKLVALREAEMHGV